MVTDDDVAVPVIAADELLVRVEWSTVNRTSCAIRAATPQPAIRAFYGLRRPRRPILGTDFAGVVERVGREVRGLSAGDRIFGFDDSRMGGHGEYLAISAKAAVAKIPDGIGSDIAAASVEGAHYALTYVERAALGPRQSALVYGGGGAIGSAAIQLLASRGVDVVAVAEDHQLELMAELGARRVVDRQAEDFTAIDERFDLVFDSVGKTTFAACRSLLHPGGMFMATELGPKLQNLWLPFTTRWLDRRVLFPLPFKPREHVKTVEQMFRVSLEYF